VDWLDGNTCGIFLNKPFWELRDKKIGQVWDFYNYQLSSARFTADPHRSSFHNNPEELGIIDFGCIKNAF